MTYYESSSCKGHPPLKIDKNPSNIERQSRVKRGGEERDEPGGRSRWSEPYGDDKNANPGEGR